MQYEVRYVFNGIKGTYYVTFDSDSLQRVDIEYSIRQSVARFLGSSQFDIIYSRVK